MTELSDTRADESPSTGGRWAAGEDPAKRKQILDGARRVFMKLGFDAASMNDVTREAGVSKGTLYVYFANKEELFTAMMESERAAFVASVRNTLKQSSDPDVALHDFGMTFVSHLTEDKVINAMRTVIGVRDRMPHLCQRFFTGPENIRTVLKDFLTSQVEAGRFEIDDIELAARQFLELCGGSFFKLRLFGDMDAPPPREEMDRVVNGAIRVFTAAYGVKKQS
ncbi:MULTISPECIES: TetR/AcrR family transcriptional regulator [unclassified Rhizobium]|uniref:TetR/AcrR family transcriptional regulator n=1 Tax=unclassified Rhizobium TaxID=2613769 RepID=UPI0002716D8D|nr:MULTISPECIES: TetR/AcrR family transcriptional regulator [unclassified Rhizobium]EJL48561.1 transcriptional regulator [Rhizobium sp. CF122]MBB3399018.1 AcrR family transcriptional regulator [Rhizobium sp. BK060]MBB4167064.1 AcrR family transcriptional regulator [Rhizobium sp. BK538]TCM77850.1 TetR family transcriptional regulator [Rhizobium sp. BK068]